MSHCVAGCWSRGCYSSQKAQRPVCDGWWPTTITSYCISATWLAPSCLLLYLFHCLVILIPYLAQPIKKWQWKIYMWQGWIDINGMYLGPGELYKLKFSYNSSTYIYAPIGIVHVKIGLSLDKATVVSFSWRLSISKPSVWHLPAQNVSFRPVRFNGSHEPIARKSSPADFVSIIFSCNTLVNACCLIHCKSGCFVCIVVMNVIFETSMLCWVGILNWFQALHLGGACLSAFRRVAFLLTFSQHSIACTQASLASRLKDSTTVP